MTDRDRELAREALDGLPLDEPFQQVAWSDSQYEYVADALARAREEGRQERDERVLRRLEEGSF